MRRLLFIIPLLLAVSTAQAAYVDLAWNPNQEIDLGGYKVYFGTSSRNYTHFIDVEDVTSYRVDNLTDGVTLYFALAAYNKAGAESALSSEVSGIGVPTGGNSTPPVANAGPDQTVKEGATVALDGSNSTDSGGSIVSYQWAQIAGPSVSLSDPTSAQTTFTSPEVSQGGVSLKFQVTVTDDRDLQSTATCIVNVTWVNTPPVADAGPDQTVKEAATVTLDGSNSKDSDDGILSYSWKQIGGTPVTVSNPNAAKATLTAPEVEQGGTSLTFQLTVTDKGGLKATDTCTVNVTWVDTPPVANAGPDQTVNEGTTVMLDGTSSKDSEDGIASYLWKQTAGAPVTLSDPTAAQPTFTAPEVVQGGASLTFQLTVTDTGGLQSTDTCIVNVSWANNPPTAEAGPTQTVKSGTRVTLDGSHSTDTDNGIAAYQWKQIIGTPVRLSNSTGTKATFVAPRVRTLTVLTFRLTVRDKGGLQASDTVSVNVKP